MEWISVDDRLPDDDDIVVSFRPKEESLHQRFIVMYGWAVKTNYSLAKTITCWTPLNPPGRDTA